MLSHADNQGLLSYGIATSPDPLKASTQTGSATTAELVVTVSNLTPAPIHCRKILFSLPIGENADALTSNTEILCTASPSDKWQIRGDGEGVFTATPVSPDDNQILSDGISFLFYGIEVNKQVGTFTLSIEEESSIDNELFTLKSNAYDLTKFPSGFYFGNFAAAAPMVDNGDTVTLTWTGSDLASYTIKYGTEQVQVTDVRTWTSPALTQNTTFELMATVLESGQSVNHYQYLTVIVDKPELVSSSITTANAKVSGAAEIDGAAVLKSTIAVSSDALVEGRLLVKGPIETDSSVVGLGIVPVGSIVPYAGVGYPTIDSGWLLCEGQSLNISDYAVLYSRILTQYGQGDDPGSTFNLPDYRGMFLRGVDGGTGNDPDADDRFSQADEDDTIGDVVGSRQEDEFKSHSHQYDKFPGDSGNIADGRYWESEKKDTEETGGNETRPKNVYVYYLIRAK